MNSLAGKSTSEKQPKSWGSSPGQFQWSWGLPPVRKRLFIYMGLWVRKFGPQHAGVTVLPSSPLRSRRKILYTGMKNLSSVTCDHMEGIRFTAWFALVSTISACPRLAACTEMRIAGPSRTGGCNNNENSFEILTLRATGQITLHMPASHDFCRCGRLVLFVCRRFWLWVAASCNTPYGCTTIYISYVV